MDLIPFDWNVIIRGFWNRAIFTPGRVAKNLFGLEEGSALQLLVPVDGVNPTKITHDNIVVSVASGTLEIATEKNDYSRIVRCLDTARRALDWLKETPVFAGGYNIRYRVDGESAVTIAGMTQCGLDKSLSDASLNIRQRSNVRVIAEEKGEIAVITEIDQASNVSVVFNFNRSSTSVAELVEWFSICEDDLESKVTELLDKIYGIKETAKND